MAQKRRTITGDTTKYPMILESVLYEQLKDLAKSLKVSVAVVIQEALKQYLVGNAKDKEIQRLTEERNLLRGQLGSSGKSKELAIALSESIEIRTHLEKQLKEANEKLSDMAKAGWDMLRGIEGS